MENFRLVLPASPMSTAPACVGVVASGDLEVLYTPLPVDQLTIEIQTSVNGQQPSWEALLKRLAQRRPFPSGTLRIHDFGATPGVAALRVEQCLDATLTAPPHPTSLSGEESFIELSARDRARALLDANTFRELLSPYDHLTSPWLTQQQIVVAADDGMVIAKGTLDGTPCVIAAVEGAFQGGSMGEVSGAKMAAALELAAEDNRRGVKTQVILLLESGGVRLQEANLGLAAIAEIHAALVDLQRYVPVVGIIAGMVGCFGGMSITAALCSRLIMTREGRLGLNGPQVIEQEAGITEYDASDRPFIWSLTGGEIRYRCGFVDALVEDSVAEIRQALRQQLNPNVTMPHRLSSPERILATLRDVDTTQQITPVEVIHHFGLKERL